MCWSKERYMSRNKIDISAIFQFFADDPETALIVGGILIIIIGIFLTLISSTIGIGSIVIGFIVMFIGIVIYRYSS
jgi:Mg/Co/Ni transporter MgtE